MTIEIECDDGRLTYFFMHEPIEITVVPSSGVVAINFHDDKGLKLGVLLDNAQAAFLQSKLWDLQKKPQRKEAQS